MAHIENYDELYEQFATAADKAQAYLNETDHKVLECLELGQQIPSDISEARRQARAALSENTEKKQDLWDLDNLELFPKWVDRLNKENPQREGKDILFGERLQDDDKLWKCITAHKALANWKPKDSPSLFVEVSIEEWPAWKQPVGATDAYPLGAHVSHIDKHWESLIDGNVWEPGAVGSESLWKEV